MHTHTNLLIYNVYSIAQLIKVTSEVEEYLSAVGLRHPVQSIGLESNTGSGFGSGSDSVSSKFRSPITSSSRSSHQKVHPCLQNSTLRRHLQQFYASDCCGISSEGANGSYRSAGLSLNNRCKKDGDTDSDRARSREKVRQTDRSRDIERDSGSDRKTDKDKDLIGGRHSIHNTSHEPAVLDEQAVALENLREKHHQILSRTIEACKTHCPFNIVCS